MQNIKIEWLEHFWRETAAVTWSLGPKGYAMNIPEWCALTGQTPSEMEGSGWTEPIHGDDRHRVSVAWDTAVAHGSQFNTSYRLRCVDGMYRWFNARGSAIFNENGTVERWVGVILAIPAPPTPTSKSGLTLRDAGADREFVGITPGALRAARGLLGWSAAQLASNTGLSRTTIQRLEGAATGISRTSIEKTLKVLKENGIKLSGLKGIVTGVDRPGDLDAWALPSDGLA